MKELHIVVQLDDRDVQNFVRAVEDLTEIYAVGHWGAHVHEHTPPGGEIIGWQVEVPGHVRDFTNHRPAELYALKTGGTLSPIYAEEDAHAPI